MGLPGGEANSWEKSVYAVMEVSALVLLLGGLAALISLVGAKLREQPWHGPTGSA